MMGRPHRAQATTYLLVLFLFVGVTVAQMNWRPTRLDRPMNNFGGNFVFLTVQTNFIILAYVLICVIDYMFGRRVNVLVNMVERLTGMVCTVGFIMGASYYAVVHFHPETRARAEEVQNFDFYMHFLHGTPLIFVILEVLFRERPERRPVADLLSAESYVIFYSAWSFLCAHMNNGWWPYTFQQRMRLWEHLVMDLAFAVLLVPLVSLGGWIVRGRGVQLVRVSRKRRRMSRTASRSSFGACAEVLDSCADVLDSCGDIGEACADVLDSCADVLDSCVGGLDPHAKALQGPYSSDVVLWELAGGRACAEGAAHG